MGMYVRTLIRNKLEESYQQKYLAVGGQSDTDEPGVLLTMCFMKPDEITCLLSFEEARDLAVELNKQADSWEKAYQRNKGE